MLLLSLTLVCAIRPFAELLAPRLGGAAVASTAAAALGALAVGGAVPRSRARSCSPGLPARPEAATAGDAVSSATALPPVTVLPSKGVQTQLDQATARRSPPTWSRPSPRVRGAPHPQPRARGRRPRAASACRACGSRSTPPAPAPRRSSSRSGRSSRLKLNLEIPRGQAPPLVIAQVTGTERLLTYSGTPPTVVLHRQPDALRSDARAPARRAAAT